MAFTSHSPTWSPGAWWHPNGTTVLVMLQLGCPAHCTRPACCVPLEEGGGLAGRLHKGSLRGLLPGLQVSPLLLSLAVTLPCLHLSVTLLFPTGQSRHNLFQQRRFSVAWPCLFLHILLAWFSPGHASRPQGSAAAMLSPHLITPPSLKMPGPAMPPCFCVCHPLLGVSSPPLCQASPHSSF